MSRITCFHKPGHKPVKTLGGILAVLFLFSYSAQASGTSCTELFLAAVPNSSRDELRGARARAPRKLTKTPISATELSDYVSQKISTVPEFLFIREEESKLGIRVWLFGGTASGFLHYAKWDLARELGLMTLQKDRFDYDFTNIFRSTQDLDIVVDATPDQAKAFREILANRFPHFLGSKANQWEVRTLKYRIGNPGEPFFKEALLNDTDFANQNTDSNSVGMVEITLSHDPVIRDLRHWEESQSLFLEDALKNEISFFRSNNHFTTSRARAGENPEILSALRLLVKAFQYELNFSDLAQKELKEIADQFDPSKITNPIAKRRIEETAIKLIIHSVNIEYAINKLGELGLRQKLIAMGDKNVTDSFAWWLNKEPLRSKPVGDGHGKTAKELNIAIVAHETNSFFAYESITRAHSGEPNVLISRKNAPGESSDVTDGFYTRLGREGAKGTGLTIRFAVDPSAREGSDFTHSGDYVIFHNKRALKVIQESLNFGVEDLMRLAESNEALEADHSDLALLEKLKRKLNAPKIMGELEKLLNSPDKKDFERLIEILSAFENSVISKLISEDVMASVAKGVYKKVAPLSQSLNEAEIMRFVRAVGSITKTLERTGVQSVSDFSQKLRDFIALPSLSFALHKEAAFELLLQAQNPEDAALKDALPEDEFMIVISEVRDWQKSRDARKRQFAIMLDKRWSDAIEKGDTKKITALIDSGLFEISHRNVSGYSLLLLSDYYDQKAIIDWLILNPQYDFNAKNALGFTELEELRLLGKGELADKIERARPDARSRRLKVKERNDDGSPIVGFVRIEPATFMMGEGADKKLTTISRPYEVSSTITTQAQWREVVRLLKSHLGERYADLNEDPSNFKGDTNPLENVLYGEVGLWVDGLNELSSLKNPIVQENLSALLPGHHLGAEYRLPTEAEWELMARNGGLAEGLYGFGNLATQLSEHAWFMENSGNTTHPVGQKKPIFYNGKPIYDTYGNVLELTADLWANNITGGLDPHGSKSGSLRVFRGGSWLHDARNLRSAFRYNAFNPGRPYHYVGFRLSRTVP